MTRDRRPRLVVGVSGSLASVSALSWAAEESRLRGGRLHVVRVWNPAWHAAPYAAVGAMPAGEQLQAAARRGLEAAMRAQFGAAAPGDVTAELAEGVPERVLVDRSADADLLVIGAAAPAGQDQPSAGPVVRACLAGAHCPVVVIVGGEGVSASAGRPPADLAQGVLKNQPQSGSVLLKCAQKSIGGPEPSYSGHHAWSARGIRSS